MTFLDLDRLDTTYRKRLEMIQIGPFVADFYAAEHKLVVEIDGPIHDTRAEADAERQAVIESVGFRFLRLSSEEVESALVVVLGRIRQALTPRPPLPVILA